jgi:hypothetical protein
MHCVGVVHHAQPPPFRRLLLVFVRIAVPALAVIDLVFDGGESPQALGPPRLVLISHTVKEAEGQFSERQRDTESTASPTKSNWLVTHERTLASRSVASCHLESKAARGWRINSRSVADVFGGGKNAVSSGRRIGL